MGKGSKDEGDRGRSIRGYRYGENQRGKDFLD